jgi:hypothetical protein
LSHDHLALGDPILGIFLSIFGRGQFPYTLLY